MSDVVEMPKRLKDQAMTKYLNGFGPQSPGLGSRGQTYVLCFCERMSAEQVATVKALSGSQTLDHDDFLARPFLQVHWSEFHLAEQILTAVLGVGVSFKFQAKYQTWFDHREHHVFTWAILEQTMIASLREWMKRDYGEEMILEDGDRYNVLDAWNWKSAAGKAFCEELRAKKGLPPSDEANDNDDQQMDGGEECMICMDNKANTLVVPCGHSVVCAVCSEKLKDTPDRLTCVRCRSPIEEVLSDYR